MITGKGSEATRALSLVLLSAAVVLIAACDKRGPTAPRGFDPPLRAAVSDTGAVDTVPCVNMDSTHCPLIAPAGHQYQTIEAGIMDATCTWMASYLNLMWLHGNINMYGGFPWNPATNVGQVADAHFYFSTTLDGLHERMHLDSLAPDSFLHWVLRHEAAHSYNHAFTEEQADSVANACGPDQKPYS